MEALSNSLSLNWLDALIALPVLVGFVRGLLRGLIAEIIAIIAVILGVVGARMWGTPVTAWLMTETNWGDSISRLVAYVFIFLAIAITCHLIGKLFHRILKTIHLGTINKVLGALFGVVKYGLIVLVGIFALNLLDHQFHILPEKTKHESVLYTPSVDVANSIWSQVHTIS